MRGLITIAEAAKFIGMEGREIWLRRYLLERERATGRLIMTRVGEGQKRPQYRVSTSSLRKAVPELLDPVNDIRHELRALVTHSKRERELVLEKLDDIEAQIGGLIEANRQLAVAIKGRDRTPSNRHGR